MNVPIRLVVGASATTKQALLAALEEKAQAFFGDEPFRLESAVEAEAEVEVGTAQGFRQVTTWSGQAWYVNVER